MANNQQFPSMQPTQAPVVGSMDHPRTFTPPMSVQFRPVIPMQQSHQFAPVAPQHFQPVAHGGNVMTAGFPPATQQPQFPQVIPHLPAMPGQPGQTGHILSQMHTIPVQTASANRHVSSSPSMPQRNVQTSNNYAPVGIPGPHAPSTFSFPQSSYSQVPPSFNIVPQYQPVSQMPAPTNPAGSQTSLLASQATAVLAPLQTAEQQPAVSGPADTLQVTVPLNSSKEAPTYWIEHTSASGKRYYYNKKTRQSCWEKPLELMTPIERADASTNWKEYTSPDGRKYYHNKITNQSTWSMPVELKLAREQVEKTSTEGSHSETFPPDLASVATVSLGADASSIDAQGAPSSPLPVAPVTAANSVEPAADPESSALSTLESSKSDNNNVDGIQMTVDTNKPAVSTSEGAETSDTTDSTKESMNPSQEIHNSSDRAFTQNVGESANEVVVEDKVNTLPAERTDSEPVTYASKQEAKNAFKALLESTSVGIDWTWEQAMRVIINDKRYGALRTLGERKQAFNEYLGEKKKQEAEERRIKQKKAREEYRKMLEESTEVTSSTRWSKVVTIFQDDERYKSVEREKDRKDIFENYIEDLRQKERVKLQEERKHNIMEYRKFLESCDFIKASSQWRKVQERLEADERCSRLEKIDRLEIFQEYIRDLEKEEEEQRRIQKEETRKTERKNRDDFRKLMEEHVTSGMLTAKNNWRDYCLMVKDIPAFMAVVLNTSGSTPKELFEDVAEELQKQFQEDKARVKDAVKLRKVLITSTWTIEDLKAAISEDISSPPISEANLKLILDELLEKAREKEEKEAKKRKRLADDFRSLLYFIKEISSSSTWENCKKLIENSQEYSAIGDEDFCKVIFEEYTNQLKEEAKENDRRRKEEKAKKKEKEERERRKSRHGREKERGREREREEHKKDGALEGNIDLDEVPASEDRRLGKDEDRRHRKRHHSSADNQDETRKDGSKSSHRHSSDRKKSRRHTSTPESDGESRHRRHKREHRNGSRRNGDHDELEDGEFGEDKAGQ